MVQSAKDRIRNNLSEPLDETRWAAQFPRVGGLTGYGPNFIEMFRRATYFIHKIANGAKPGDLPVERPTTFELIANLRTGKALGIGVPPMLLARADEVIE
jgi:putative ABC transport system substrate-binding protein